MTKETRLLKVVVVAVALNVVCAVLLLWATTERLPVTVIVASGTVTGIVGSARVSAPVGDVDHGQVGLFLQGADPHATVYWPATPTKPSAPTPPALADWLYRLGAESGWTNARVRDLSSNRVIYPPASGAPKTAEWRPTFGDWFHHPFGGDTTARPGLIDLGSTDWRDYELDADLLRPRNPAGVLVLSSDGVSGLLFYFRPEDRDAMWFEVRDGQWMGPIASAPFHTFHQNAIASVQDVIRLALGGYPAAISLLLIVLALGRLEGLIAERLGTRWSGRWGGFGDNRLKQVFSVLAGTGTRPSRDSQVNASLPHSAGASLPPEILERVGDQPRRDRFARGIQTVWQFYCKAPLPTVTALILVGLALGSTLVVADVVLQRMPHVQDSVAYLFQAKTFALGRLWVPMPPEPDFFRHEFIVMDRGRWFSKYPPGWPMLLALGVLGGAPWIVNPICAALSVFVIYRLGTEIYRPRVGLIAAALAVVSPFFVFLSGSMMSHPSGLLFALLFAWTFWRSANSKRPVLPAVLCGLTFGIGFLIRPYTMIVIALPFALYAARQIGLHPGEATRRYWAVVPGAVPFVAAFLAYNAYFTGNPLYPPQQLWWAFDSVGFGPGHGPWGFTPIDALNNTSRNLLELVEHTYGWPEFLTLSFAMIPFLTARFRTWDWLFLASFAALVGGYGLWWADGIMYGPRFYYEGLGFLLVLTARGVDVLLDLGRWGTSGWVGPVRRLTGQESEHHDPPAAWLPFATGRSDGESAPMVDDQPAPRRVARLIAPLVVLASLVGLMAFNFAFYFPGQWQLYHGYNYVNRAKLDAVETAGIHHALVFADVGQSFEWWEYGMVFSANDPLLQGDVIYARDLGTANDRTLIQEFPGRRYYRLDGTTLTPFGNAGAP